MDPLDNFLGTSPAIVAIRERVHQLLSFATGRRLPPLLLEGETGTGKGLLARLLHRAGPRSDCHFVEINCAAIPDTLFEAELFGFERGAFTDARQAKPGMFQVAHRGVIFLDEVGLLPEAMQAKLLAVLEERTVRRLGATRSEPIDVWVLSASNADLRVAVRDHRFREDLYHRLAVLTLRIPPLRDRGRDVLDLAERFLARACSDYGLATRRLSPDAEARLLSYPWPGNVRELANVIERAALLSDRKIITGEMLGISTSESPQDTASDPSVDTAARDRLRAVLEETGWNIGRTAARLGISRNTVRARIQRLGVSIADATAEATLISRVTTTLAVGSLMDIAELSPVLNELAESRRLPADILSAIHGLEAAAQLISQYAALASSHRRRDILTRASSTLEVLQSQLTEIGRPAAAELRSIARRWLSLLTAELQAIEAAPVTTPDIPNPFVFGHPVALLRHNVFTGRRDLVRQVEDSILAAAQPPTLLLHGPRRMGKTSVLNQLPRLLGPHCAPAFLDCQDPATTESLRTLLRYASRAVVSALRSRHISISPLSPADFNHDPFAVFRDWVDNVEERLPTHMRILLCLDEYERLHHVLTTPWAKSFLDLLRHLSQHHSRFVLLFSGVRTFTQLGHEWTQRFINARLLRVSFLKSDEARHLLTDPVADFPVTYDAAAIDAVIEATNGHPFLTQAIAFELVELLNAHRSAHATLAHVQEAMNRALISAEAYFANVWSDAGVEGRAFLRALAVDSTLRESPETVAQLRDDDILNESLTFSVPIVHRWILERCLSATG